MRRLAALLTPTLISALILSPAACGGGYSGRQAVEDIVQDLAVQEYGRASARYRRYEEQVLDEAAAPAWRRALEHEDATVREWAVDALSRIGEPEDIERLEGMLDDPFRSVQDAAARGLVRMDPEAARRALLERLASDDPVAQAVAAGVLGELGDPEVVEALVAQLTDPAVEPGVRSVVAQGLAEAGDPRAAGPLTDVALDRDNPTQLRRTAAEVLATLEGAGVEAALRRLLEADDEYIRDVGRRALEQVG